MNSSIGNFLININKAGFALNTGHSVSWVFITIISSFPFLNLPAQKVMIYSPTIQSYMHPAQQVRSENNLKLNFKEWETFLF